MPAKAKPLPARKDLTFDEIEHFHSLLDESVTGFDCGTLCSPHNGGVPYCCSVENAVPLLYRSEMKYLQSQGNMWEEWFPKTADERKLKKEEDRHQMFCECKGIAACSENRHLRSISCRTFPLEPYLDRRGVFVGLTFIRDFTEKDEHTGKIKCPLTQRKKDIRQEFVDSHYLFWERLLLRREEEFETYLWTSKKLRREFEKDKRDFHVFFPTHLKESKNARQFIY